MWGHHRWFLFQMVFMDRNSEVIPSISDKWWSCFQWFLPAMPQCPASTRTIFVCEFDGGVVMGADTRTSTGLSDLQYLLSKALIWYFLFKQAMQVEFDLYSLGSTKFRLLNQTQSRKTYVCNYHFQFYRFVLKKWCGWKANTLPIELHARSPRWGSKFRVSEKKNPSRLCVHNLLLKLFLAANCTPWQMFPLCWLLKNQWI